MKNKDNKNKLGIKLRSAALAAVIGFLSLKEAEAMHNDYKPGPRSLQAQKLTIDELEPGQSKTRVKRTLQLMLADNVENYYGDYCLKLCMHMMLTGTVSVELDKK